MEGNDGPVNVRGIIGVDAGLDAFGDCVTVPGCFPYGGACGDCDDADPTINPRGSERKPPRNRRDGKDNDCNGVDG